MDTYERSVVWNAIERLAKAAEILNQELRELKIICDESAKKMEAAALVGVKHEG